MENDYWSDRTFQQVLIGNSPEIDQIRKNLPSFGKSNQHVTILGEPGTEKLVVAKIIFENSARQKDLMIITDSTKLNSGYDREIFKRIRNINADKLVGTIVIQNIENLEKNVQQNVLNLAKKGYMIENGPAYETDFRIIATAAHRIHEQVKQEKFDSELFLSLSELMIKIPSLRDRKQDIPVLFEYFLKKICNDIGRPVPPINFEIFNQMLKHNWAGNIKELENVIRSLVLMSPEGELSPEVLPFFNTQQQFSKIELQSLGMAVANVEKELIEKALRKFAGNQSRAAKILGISEPNMRFKMKKLGIRKEDFILGTQ